MTAEATADPTISSKQAQEQSIISEINSLEVQVSSAIERWNLANVRLGHISHNLQQSRFELGVARTNLKRAQLAVARQAVDEYTSGDSNSALEVLLGASSLDDLLNRMESVTRVNDQRASVVGDVSTFKKNITAQTSRLHRAQDQQKQVVAERAAEKHAIDQQLAERNQLLQSVRAEIAHLQAVERARQLEIARRIRAQQQAAAIRPPAVSTFTASAASASSAPTVAPPSAVPEVQTVAAPPASHYGGVVGIAMQYLGTPYVWGGASPGGFDCSGFVMYVYAQMGVSLPHSSYAQYSAGVPVSYSDLQPGDLVFFDGLGHVGIYVGGGNFIHAPHTGDVVKISSLTGWYASTFVGARRIL